MPLLNLKRQVTDCHEITITFCQMLYCDHNDPPYLFSQAFAFIRHRQISVIFQILQNDAKGSLKKAVKNL